LPLKPSYLILAGAGGIVVYSGLKGYSIGHTIRDIIAGHNPQKNPVLTAQISSGYGYGMAGSFGYGTPGGAHGNIAAIAESHIGFPYVWGGAPASGATDCSGFVNMCVGMIGKRSIPGYPHGAYDGSVHGPNTLLWLAWLGTGITRIHLSQTKPGDLAIWQTHMGIITGGGNMVSDLNPSLGTQQTTIKDGGPPGEILVCARLK
jgi:cell wall-associated NlpC family hydrolase